MTILHPAAPTLIHAGRPYRAYQVLTAADGAPVLRTDRSMTLRSALHRLFGVGKTAGDIARNRHSWNALLNAIEARAGRVVRERVCRSALSLPGDRQAGLTVANRIERGSYLSCAALTAINALFNETSAVEYANRDVYARLFPTAEEQPSPAPLERLLDALIAGQGHPVADVDGAGPDPSLAQTHAYVARQLKLGLQQQVAGNRQRDPQVLARKLVAHGAEFAALQQPALRDRWLQQFDARLIRGPAHNAAADKAGLPDVLAVQRERAVAALLSEWRRHDLKQALERNGAAPPAERQALLTALKRREISDAICHCDRLLATATEPSAIKRCQQQRAEWVAQWRRDDLAEEMERDQVRQQQLQLLLQEVRTEIDAWTARGERLDVETLTRIVAGLISRPAYLRQFLLARNLQFLYDVGHGADRASTMAQLVRACVRLPPDQRGDDTLDAGDFHWLAASLEAGGDGHVVVMDAGSLPAGARRMFARLTRDRWPIALVCDMVAARLDAHAEERRQGARAWRAHTASPDLHWHASVAALHDPIRAREWTLDDLAPAAFEAFKPFLLARHAAVRHMATEQQEAGRQLAGIRSIYPALGAWVEATPPGACAMTLADLASLQITARLLNLHNLRLEGKRRFVELEIHRRAAEESGDVPPGPAMGTGGPILADAIQDRIDDARHQSMRDMMNAKRQIEQQIRDALDGTESTLGLLEMSCHVLEQFQQLWPRWREAYCATSVVVASPDLLRRGRELHTMADKALATLSAIRSRHVAAVRDCSVLPADLAERAQTELSQLEEALHRLERSVTWVQSMLPATSPPGEVPASATTSPTVGAAAKATAASARDVTRGRAAGSRVSPTANSTGGSTAIIARPQPFHLPQLIKPLARQAIELMTMVHKYG